MKEFYKELLRKAGLTKVKESEDIKRINNALFELNRARANFNMVVGADNVELAILELNAAEKRYQNLIKEVKIKGIQRFDNREINFIPNKVVLD